MADVEESEEPTNIQISEPDDDILTNGNGEQAKEDGLLHPEDTDLPDQMIPRRSSLVKDASRRQQQRKTKTVSFSSMPNEKTVVNGEFCEYRVFCHQHNRSST